MDTPKYLQILRTVTRVRYIINKAPENMHIEMSWTHQRIYGLCRNVTHVNLNGIAWYTNLVHSYRFFRESCRGNSILFENSVVVFLTSERPKNLETSSVFFPASIRFRCEALSFTLLYICSWIIPNLVRDVHWITSLSKFCSSWSL